LNHRQTDGLDGARALGPTGASCAVIAPVLMRQWLVHATDALSRIFEDVRDWRIAAQSEGDPGRVFRVT